MNDNIRLIDVLQIVLLLRNSEPPIILSIYGQETGIIGTLQRALAERGWKLHRQSTYNPDTRVIECSRDEWILAGKIMDYEDAMEDMKGKQTNGRNGELQPKDATSLDTSVGGTATDGSVQDQTGSNSLPTPNVQTSSRDQEGTTGPIPEDRRDQDESLDR